MSQQVEYYIGRLGYRITTNPNNWNVFIRKGENRFYNRIKRLLPNPGDIEGPDKTLAWRKEDCDEFFGPYESMEKLMEEHFEHFL